METLEGLTSLKEISMMYHPGDVLHPQLINLRINKVHCCVALRA